MKTKDYKKLDDEGIVKILDANIRRSVGYYDSQISRERKKAVDYYNATLPKKAHDGNSSYVSMDVYDSVESMKAALLETFASGHKTVRFAPQNADDVKMADVCTEYTDYVAHRQNDLYSVMSTAIHDGLIARCGIVRVYWKEQTESHLEYVEDLTEDELDAVLAEENTEIEEIEESLGFYSGDIRVTQDTSQVVIENVAPEEFLIEPQARDLDDVLFCAHRSTKTISELRQMGYDEELIDKIGDHEDTEMETDPEVLARHEEIGSDRGFNAFGYQDQVRSVTCYECYTMLDVEATGEAELYRLVKAGNVLLEQERVEEVSVRHGLGVLVEEYGRLHDPLQALGFEADHFPAGRPPFP